MLVFRRFLLRRQEIMPLDLPDHGEAVDRVSVLFRYDRSAFDDRFQLIFFRADRLAVRTVFTEILIRFVCHHIFSSALFPIVWRETADLIRFLHPPIFELSYANA